MSGGLILVDSQLGDNVGIILSRGMTGCRRVGKNGFFQLPQGQLSAPDARVPYPVLTQRRLTALPNRRVCILQPPDRYFRSFEPMTLRGTKSSAKSTVPHRRPLVPSCRRDRQFQDTGAHPLRPLHAAPQAPVDASIFYLQVSLEALNVHGVHRIGNMLPFLSRPPQALGLQLKPIYLSKGSQLRQHVEGIVGD
jgi:hypothetical protein